MIYCTGDIHGDRLRFKDKRLKKLKRGDSLIVCGDFGFIWDGSADEKKFLKKLGRKRYNILFVDGFHENFGLLNDYPVSEWNGGKVKVISGRLRYLCRGEIFDIDGVKLFAFGGGRPQDYELRDEEQTAYEEYLPTNAEISNAITNLENADRTVDYIVSYEPPSILEDFAGESADILQKTQLSALFDEIVKHCEFKKWIFGKCHKNRVVSPKYTAIYTSVIELETPKTKKRRFKRQKSLNQI